MNLSEIIAFCEGALVNVPVPQRTNSFKGREIFLLSDEKGEDALLMHLVIGEEHPRNFRGREVVCSITEETIETSDGRSSRVLVLTPQQDCTPNAAIHHVGDRAFEISMLQPA